MFRIIPKSDIQQALVGETRQYLVGNLQRPQALSHIHSADIEIGITSYESSSTEVPHFHTEATEFQYVLSGWTRYQDLESGQEYDFKKGDFYVIEPETKYVQKSKRGTEILFIKLPSINDKKVVEMTPQVAAWMKEYLETQRTDYYEDPNAPTANSIKPAAAVAVCSEDRVLMVQRADNGKWTLPGGTLEIGESLPQCAARELREETNLRVDIVDVIGTYTDPEIKIEYSDGEVRQEFTIVFLGRTQDTRVQIDDESVDYSWIPLSELGSIDMASSQRKRISDLLRYLDTGQKRFT